MNSLEAIRKAAFFEPVPRIPVVPQLFAYTGIQNGVPIDRYVSEAETLAACQLAEWKKYSYDALFAVMDTAVEAEAMGAQLQYHRNRYPEVSSYPLTSAGQIPDLGTPDPLLHGRMPKLLRAAEILRERSSGRAAVVGAIMGPMTIAVQVLGAEATLNCAIDFPGRFTELLDTATETAIRFGSAQLDYGVHVPLIFDPSASPEFIPPQFFREFEMPRLEKISSALKEKGAETVWLHIAGKVLPILPYYPHIGISICNFDYCVGAQEAAGAVPESCLAGNIKPFAFIGTDTSAVENEAASLISFFSKRGGFILSSGCEIPPESNPKMVAALVSSAEKYSDI